MENEVNANEQYDEVIEDDAKTTPEPTCYMAYLFAAANYAGPEVNVRVGFFEDKAVAIDVANYLLKEFREDYLKKMFEGKGTVNVLTEEIKHSEVADYIQSYELAVPNKNSSTIYAGTKQNNGSVPAANFLTDHFTARMTKPQPDTGLQH